MSNKVQLTFLILLLISVAGFVIYDAQRENDISTVNEKKRIDEHGPTTYSNYENDEFGFFYNDDYSLEEDTKKIVITSPDYSEYHNTGSARRGIKITIQILTTKIDNEAEAKRFILNPDVGKIFSSRTYNLPFKKVIEVGQFGFKSNDHFVKEQVIFSSFLSHQRLDKVLLLELVRPADEPNEHDKIGQEYFALIDSLYLKD